MNELLAMRMAMVEGFNGRPALIDPRDVEKVATLCMTMATAQTPPTPEQRASAEQMVTAAVESAFDVSFPRERSKPFLFNDGIAFVPMRGTLVHRNGDPWYGTRGYDDIRREFDAAMADPDVAGIVFDAHSGGGMVYGNFELAEHIRSKRDEKPSMTVVNAGAMSGAYSLGSSAKRMVTTPSGDTGSIGVLTMHVDLSAALEKFGVKMTLVHAGDHKVDGNPFNPLPDSVRADMQARLDGMWQKFISVVAINRGMSEQAVRDTQARVYQADEAVKIGLVDAVMSPQDAIASFRAEVFGSSTNDSRSANMSDTKKPESVDAAKADDKIDNTTTDATVDAGKKDEQVDAGAAMQARCAAITTSEEAQGREGLANHLAFKTTMSVEDAKVALAAAPKAVTAASAASALEAAMSGSGGGPEVSNNAGDGDGDEEEKADGGLLGAYVGATGNKSALRVVK
ncbi:MAG: S49 family peptidase [Lysobacter sp.]